MQPNEQQLELFDIPSPCKGICQVDNRGYCLGCFRSRDERFRWLKMADAEKRRVLKLCQQRCRRRQKAQSAHDTTEQGPSQDELEF